MEAHATEGDLVRIYDAEGGAREDETSESPPEGRAPGFVYVLSNASMHGLIKIGSSQRHPDIRASELSRSSGILTPFFVEAYYEVTDAAAAEAAAHEAFSEVRESPNREFFRARLPRALWLLTPALVAFRPARNKWAAAGECPQCFSTVGNASAIGRWDGRAMTDPPGGDQLMADCGACGVRLVAYGGGGDGALDVLWFPAAHDKWTPSSVNRARRTPVSCGS
jgi:T5orf172 domain-containing protein